MGSVAVIFKIVPEDMGKLGQIRENVTKLVPGIQKIEEEDIGFGIKALKVTVVMPDGPGSYELEEKLSAVDGVSRAEIISVDRL